MLAETVTNSQTFDKPNGLKKVFSVPVGKLRSKIVRGGRNGSSSISGSRSSSRHEVLLRNNRELARALSNEKKRFRGVVTENVNLKSRLHETRLEVHNLEKQLSECRQLLTTYQNGVMNHLRDAVKHSVSLTECLELAMGLYLTEPTVRNAVPASGVVSVCQPQRQRVNPMVSGYTIRHPTISLKRVVMSTEIRNEETEEVPNQQQFPETIDDDSQSIDETRERPGGLSTCLEEDEDCSADTNSSELADEEENDEEGDSIGKKVVSIWNTTLEKEKNRSRLEAEQSSSFNDTIAHLRVESSCAEQVKMQTCNVPNNCKKPCKSERPGMPDYLPLRNPVVALNDISRFLHNSNSVNVQKVISGIIDSKSGHKDQDEELYSSANEKENRPKSATMRKASLKQPCVSSRIDSKLLKRNNEMCIEGSIERNNSPVNEKKGSVKNNDAVQDISIPHIEDDPLEGTSWMHLHLFSEKKMTRKKGRPKNSSKETHLMALETKKFKNSCDKIVNSSKEIVSDAIATSESGEEIEISVNSTGACNDDYDVSDFDIGLKNCPVAQSTPMNPGKPSENTSVSNVSDVSKAACKSNRDSHCSNSLVSSGDGCSQGNSQVKDVDKSVAVPLVDTKLDKKAFVTVRVRRLELPDLSNTNLADNLPEADVLGETSNETENFLGFPVSPEVEKRMVMKDIMAITKELNAIAKQSQDDYGSNITTTSITSSWRGSVTHDSATSIDDTSCDPLASENGRPRRRAAPKGLKEPTLNKKLRQESTKKKAGRKAKKLGGSLA
ncbi:uncharacterized protein [Hetaerina americana]|uniref:uncharacterized protein isoform X2 n=1 Tax=Hetaerina americana TaxID=62018 RepID=UPI003A7F62C2